MQKIIMSPILLALLFSIWLTLTCYAKDVSEQTDLGLAKELAQLQGVWEMSHGTGENATRSIKTIKGNQVTIQRFDVATGILKGERIDDFVLGKSGDLHTLTFYPVGSSPKDGTSYVYKIEDETLVEVTGLLHGDAEVAVSPRFSVSRWKRVSDIVQQTDSSEPTDKDLAADLALLQGTWTMGHGKNEQGDLDTRSTKTIEGNKETLRRFEIETGILKSEHTVEFILSKSGNARVYTFYSVGGSPEDGVSYVYKVDDNTLLEVTGLLQGEQFTNYVPQFGVFRWKRSRQCCNSKDLQE